MSRQNSGLGAPGSGGLFKQGSGLFRGAPDEDMDREADSEVNKLEEDMQRPAAQEEQPGVW